MARLQAQGEEKLKVSGFHKTSSIHRELKILPESTYWSCQCESVGFINCATDRLWRPISPQKSCLERVSRILQLPEWPFGRMTNPQNSTSTPPARTPTGIRR